MNKFGEKRAEYAKKYYLAHKDKIIAYGKAYHAAHKEEHQAKRRAYGKIYDAAHKEKKKAYYIAHRETWKQYNRNYWLSHEYGLSQNEFELMFSAQEGKCAICKTDQFDGNGKRPHIDHSHATGRVRGILCGNCNRALGAIKDNQNIARSIIEYLDRSGDGPRRCK